MRRRLPVLVLAIVLVLGLAPATAVSSVPVVGSDNLTLVGAMPNAAAISSQFSSDSPHLYLSTLHGIDVYDISDPTLPILTGSLPMAFFQNEAVTLGEREGGEKFVLIGIDLFQVSPTALDAAVTGSQVIVVEVTDPTSPEIVATLDTATSTHTLTCVNDECTHAYTAGSASAFEIVDLTDFRAPKVAKQVPSTAGPGLQGHDWDVDAAGYAWHVGGAGAAAYDVSDPENPVLLNSTTSAGQAGNTDYNNFILHNSIRPDADAFASRAPQDVIPIRSTGPRPERGFHDRPVDPAEIRPGEVLLVTEEDYIDATCEAEGAFSTWHVQQLNPGINPEGRPGDGTIAPLDKWNTELLDSGIATPAGAFCSAHYFDYHQDGFVAQGWYQQGLRILDVRNPTEIKQVGYWFTGVTETWGAYWVPERDEDGRVTGDKTNLLYTNDPTKGIEIFEVALPDTAPEDTEDLRAPILPQWLAVDPTLEARKSPTWGYACALPA